MLKDKSILPAKEIYVFTDLSRASWRTDETAKLQDRLHEVAGVSLYLIDVGVTDPSNFALGDLHLSRQVVAAGGSVEIQTDVSSLGAEGQRAGRTRTVGVRRYVAEISAAATIRCSPASRRASISASRRSSRARSRGWCGSWVRTRWRPTTCAISASRSARPGPCWSSPSSRRRRRAVYLTGALAPVEWQKRHQAGFECKVIGYSELVNQKLDEFAAVCLLDPPGLEAGAWQRLTDYAAAGHGVGVFLGRHAAPIEAFNSPAAQQLLPGRIKEQVPREEGNTYLAPQNYQHPVLKPFAPYATRIPWNQFPVFRYWRIDDLAPDASTVIAYNDGRPALLERTIRSGQVAGHVLLMSTPLSDIVNRRDAWNWLPGSGEDRAWPFPHLVNYIASYLVGSGEQQLNYLAGTNSVSLAIDDPTRSYVLTRPPLPEQKTGISTPLPPPEKAELSISGLEQVGNYQVRGVGDSNEPERGFSINLSSQVTQLARLTDQELSEIFGPFKPQVARSSEKIIRNVHESRIGREIYPWLILAFAGLLAVEYVVSNWFYKRE